jgi:predicted AAA+ superfamily ATPase
MPERGWDELRGRAERALELLERFLVRSLPSDSSEAAVGDVWAYRWRDGGLEPIEHPDLYPASGLLGVERSVDRLLRNLEAFSEGRPALDALLYGERGTGKSSAVRAALGELGPRGLRLVEVLREDLLDLPLLFAALRDRKGRYVLFCDDLSFEAGDATYKELKSVLDGGVEARPRNVLIVATSNRRHLVPEHMSENLAATLGPGGELHPSETTEEKLSLSDRFGLLLPFFAFDQETYLRIVDYHAQQLGLAGRIPVEDQHRRALRFALERSSRSGRTARQACIALLQELEP